MLRSRSEYLELGFLCFCLDTRTNMADPIRFLITGASGLLGRALMSEFSRSPTFKVLGLAHSRISGNLKKVDLLDFEETRQVVEDFRPHFLLHSAAERRPDVVEKDEVSTQKLNIGTTEFLSKLVEGFNKGLERPQHFLLYISSDYVFDGTNAPYKPDDKPNPLNKYGKSKLEGEEAVKQYHPNGIILRIPVLYGDVEYLGESAVTVLLSIIKDQETPTVIDDYQLRYPTLVDDVAKVCQFIAKKKLEDPSLCGIFHWSGQEQMTKYRMVCTMAQLFGLPMDHVKPNKNPPTSPTVRPYNTALDSGKLEDMMSDRSLSCRTSFKEGLEKYLKKHV